MRRYPNLMSPRRGGYWPECLGVILIAAVIVAALGALGGLLGSHIIAASRRLPAGMVAGTAGPALTARDCVTVTFGWRTPTGHEADAPVTVCGAGLRRDLACELSEPLAPGAVADCAGVPVARR